VRCQPEEVEIASQTDFTPAVDHGAGFLAAFHGFESQSCALVHFQLSEPGIGDFGYQRNAHGALGFLGGQEAR
jgi:hypothetical protein